MINSINKNNPNQWMRDAAAYVGIFFLLTPIPGVGPLIWLWLLFEALK